MIRSSGSLRVMAFFGVLALLLLVNGNSSGNSLPIYGNVQDSIKDSNLKYPSILRLHVVAHSDSPRDQDFKLQTRDLVLRFFQEPFQNVDSCEEGLIYVRSHLRELELEINEFLLELDTPYQARGQVGMEKFPTIDYGSLRLPAGSYLALTIILGEGKGKNWWCVLYPPLCFLDAREIEALQVISTQEVDNTDNTHSFVNPLNWDYLKEECKNNILWDIRKIKLTQ